jgi:hypothetical protein
MALTRNYSAEDPVYLKGKCSGSDTIFVACSVQSKEQEVARQQLEAAEAVGEPA